jgi:hypothetical protein
MDKVMNAEIEKILVTCNCDMECKDCGFKFEKDCPKAREIKIATSSITALIIKWLEKADICDECKNKLLTNLTDRI